ncbi:MAG: type II toxin-antitoxin system HicB family antitoxin [Rickettsiales bacterium]
MKNYHINIFFSAEDGGYVADIPDLAGCSAFGDTPEQALAEVQKAKEAWLKVARTQKRKAPEAHYRPVMYQLSSHV